MSLCPWSAWTSVHRKHSQFPLCPYNKFRSKVETKIMLSVFRGKTEISYIIYSRLGLSCLFKTGLCTHMCTSVGPTRSRRLWSLSLSLSARCTHTLIHIIYMDLVITHIPLSKNIAWASSFRFSKNGAFHAHRIFILSFSFWRVTITI